MLVLFVIVAAAVLTVTWSRWENLPKWILRVCGMLSIALGVRAVALLTVLLLVPVFPQFAWSDEPVPASQTGETGESDTPTAESGAPELPAIEPAEAKTEPAEAKSDESSAVESNADKEAAATSPEVPASAASPASPAALEPASAPATSEIKTDVDEKKDAKSIPSKTSEKTSDPAAKVSNSAAEPASPAVEAEPNAAPAPAAELPLSPAPSNPPSPATASSLPAEAFPPSDLPQYGLDRSRTVPSTKQDVGSPPQAEFNSDFGKTTKDEIAAVSREPIRFITNVNYLTENRPSWIELPPTYDEASGILHVAVKAGPYRSVRDCEPDLEKEVSLAVADFVNQHLKARYASTFVTYSLDELRRRKVVREQFSEQLGTSLGLMNQVHAQLVFDDKFRDEIEHRWSEVTSKSRLAQTGLGAGVVLLLLSTLFSYFKVDTATKGYYTGRLQFATAGAILALVAASVVLAKCIPWM